MIQLEQVHQDIDALPEEAQNLVIDFIQFLKYRYSQPKSDRHPLVIADFNIPSREERNAR